MYPHCMNMNTVMLKSHSSNYGPKDPHVSRYQICDATCIVVSTDEKVHIALCAACSALGSPMSVPYWSLRAYCCTALRAHVSTSREARVVFDLKQDGDGHRHTQD